MGTKLSQFETMNRLQSMGMRDRFSLDATQDAMYRAGALTPGALEKGMRTTPEDRIKYIYQQMYVQTDLRSTILDIRNMDKLDGRVKELHKRTARMATKSGLKLTAAPKHKTIHRAWDRFQRRLNLNRREKLQSDFSGFMKEGNLPMQWVLDQARKQVVAAVRMPSETIIPKVGPAGVFENPAEAYAQFDYLTGKEIAIFPLWQLNMIRLNPQNFDDMGSLGRPYLDATREVWQKLRMTEEDLVIRRRHRAPQKLAHVLEGADDPTMKQYQERVEADAGSITTDYFVNKKGAVTAIEGDANLDQIKDVVHLLDTFYAGGPAPKGLFGYTGNLSRDILEDLKRDYFDEVDALQDTLSYVYYLGFCLDLLLQGVNPDHFDFEIQFAERKTETPNQAADRALKLQAIGASQQTVFETAGLNLTKETERLDDEGERFSPYPEPGKLKPGKNPNVKITPGNQRKNESGTSVDNK